MVHYTFNTIRYDERNSMDDSENNIDTYKMTSKELEQAFTNELRRSKKSREIDEKKLWHRATILMKIMLILSFGSMLNRSVMVI